MSENVPFRFSKPPEPVAAIVPSGQEPEPTQGGIHSGDRREEASPGRKLFDALGLGRHRRDYPRAQAHERHDRRRPHRGRGVDHDKVERVLSFDSVGEPIVPVDGGLSVQRRQPR